MKQLRKVAPVIISLVLIGILISYAPWGKVEKSLDKLTAQAIIVLVLLSLLYYSLKTVRFWIMLKAMKIRKPFGLVALSYMSAQPVTLLPAGEIYRSKTLEQHTGVPLKDSIPQFTMQAILEGAGLATVGIIAALMLGALRIPVLILSLFVVIALVGVKQGYLAQVGRQLNRVPFINLRERRLRQFSERNRAMLTRTWLPPLLALSIATELTGAAVAYVTVTDLGGSIPLSAAALAYIIPLLVGFLSFLPGGLGASEHSTIGILLISDLSIGLAVAATLVIRATIVLTGVIYGLIAFAIGRWRLAR